MLGVSFMSYNLRVVFFLTIITMAVMLWFGKIRDFFMENIYLNGLIVLILAIGTMLVLLNMAAINNARKWLNKHKPDNNKLDSKNINHLPILLKPLEFIINKSYNHISFNVADSIYNRLEEHRETNRYVVNTLVFLGLLGTFWGLLEIITGITAAINKIDETAQITTQLSQPLDGMAIAFSSSLFGLASSIILGFIAMQNRHLGHKFMEVLEAWVLMRSAYSDAYSNKLIKKVEDADSGLPLPYIKGLLENNATQMEKLNYIIEGKLQHSNATPSGDMQELIKQSKQDNMQQMQQLQRLEQVLEKLIDINSKSSYLQTEALRGDIRALAKMLGK
jgi:hypothetical protein